jgi:hypothetical protein
MEQYDIRDSYLQLMIHAILSFTSSPSLVSVRLSVMAEGEGEEEAAAACFHSVCYHGFLSVKFVCKLRLQQELDEQVEICVVVQVS